MRLLTQRIVKAENGSDIKVNYFNETLVKLLLNNVTNKSTQWLKTHDGRFSVVFSFSNVTIAKNKMQNVIGLTVYPYITQNYFNGKLRRVLPTPIKDYTEVKIKQAIENFNKAFENVAHAGLSSKQTDKEGKPYEGRRCFVTVYFNMDEIVQELEKNNVDISKDYSFAEAVSEVFPAFYLFLDKVKNTVASLVDCIEEETKSKTINNNKKTSYGLFDVYESIDNKESGR